MQYKIPVQIENEDPIIFNLSIRQLGIILAGGGIGYVIFNGLKDSVDPAVALMPGVIILLFSILVAVFKHSEMTFTEFIFAFIRYKVNVSARTWMQGTDSFSPLKVGYITQTTKHQEKIDFSDKMSKIKELDEKLKNI